MSNINEKYLVENQLNYHIIPFAFDLEYKEANQLMEQKCSVELWKRSNINDENLLRHINNLITDKPNIASAIAKKYVLEQKGRGNKFLGLQNKSDSIYIFSVNKKQEYKIIIDSIDLYLFETQVGFVIFKFDFLSNEADKKIDLETLTEINYRIKHLSQKENMIYYNVRKSKDEVEKRSITISELIYKITNDFKVNTYFDNNEDSKVHKSLVYSTVLLENEIDEEELEKYLYKMRKVFKESYKPVLSQLEVKDNEEILQLFKNSYWGASLEGVANITYKVKDDTTNTFMGGNYVSKLENSYLFLFLLVLNMRYSLLNFSLLCSELPSNIEECAELEKCNDKSKISVSKLEEMISFFTLRCVFRDVSNINHQSMLYKMMCKINNIDTLLEELNSEINSLSIMTKLRKEKEARDKKFEEEKKNKDIKAAEDSFKDIFLLITTAFTFISAITNIDKISDIVVEIRNSIKLLFKQGEVTPEIIMIVFILALLIGFIVLYTKYITNRKKIDSK